MSKKLLFIVSCLFVGGAWGMNKKDFDDFLNAQNEEAKKFGEQIRERRKAERYRWDDFSTAAQKILINFGITQEKFQNYYSDLSKKDYNELAVFKRLIHKGWSNHYISYEDENGKIHIELKEERAKNCSGAQEKFGTSLDELCNEGYFSNRGWLFHLDHGNEIFQFHIVKDIQTLFKNNILNLNDFKFKKPCYFSLKNGDSKILGYIFFDRVDNAGEFKGLENKNKNLVEFRMSYCSESELESYTEQKFQWKAKKFKHKEEFFIEQSKSFEGKELFMLKKIASDVSQNEIEVFKKIVIFDYKLEEHDFKNFSAKYNDYSKVNRLDKDFAKAYEFKYLTQKVSDLL